MQIAQVLLENANGRYKTTTALAASPHLFIAPLLLF